MRKVKRYLRSELAKLFEGFPTYSKSHLPPILLPSRLDLSSTSKAQNREEIKRINGLSVFVGGVEQKLPEKKRAARIAKGKLKAASGHSNSSTKKTAVRSGPSFPKEGEKVALGFRHLVKPEGIIDEPNRVNIYDKPGVVGIDKKETSACLENAPDNKLDVNVDRQRSKAKPNSQHVSHRVGNDNDRKTFARKFNKIKNNARLGPVKRIPATHNFVFEFNPCGSNISTTNSMLEAKEMSNIFNAAKEESTYFKPNGRTNSTNLQPQSLPKLRAQYNCPSNLDKREIKINYACDTNLPVIGKQDLIGDRIDPAPISEIDRDVECVKSNWQALRSQKSWARSKDYTANARTRKLYETLEKVTREVDKIQRSYLHPKANQFLHRGAVKALEETPTASLEEEACRIKDLLFPKENNRCRSNKRTASKESGSSDVNDVAKDFEKMTRLKRVSGFVDTEKSRFVPKLGMCSSDGMFIPDSCKADSLESISDFYVNRFNCKTPFEDERKTAAKIESQVGEYLDRYLNNTVKPRVSAAQDENIAHLRASKDIAQMLEELKIRSKNFDESSEELSTNCDERLSFRSAEEMEKPSAENHFEFDSDVSNNVKKKNTAIGEDVSLAEMAESTRLAVEKSRDTSIQADAMRSAKENVFAKVAFGGANVDATKNALSRILQSEYLSKDLSLYPM
ncbi:hypothetical protein KM043_005434 [Ampulex compressa]|nr:hypothetical protein KM043_005434 [Ampulex compressa]